MPEFRSAQPHGPFTEAFDNVFMVTGHLKVGPVQATRNMTVFRQGTELTLLNSVRLSDDGEKELAKLGTVKHLVRLGWFHGMDDPYYMARYAPQFWSGERVVPVNVDAGKRTELAEGAAPFGTVFRFRDGTQDEGAVVVHGGVLVTCDSLHNNVDGSQFNLGGKLMMSAFGLVGGVRVGGPWIKRMSKGKPIVMKNDFDRLLKLDFQHLVPAHGTPKPDARAAIVEAIGAKVK